MSKNYSKDKKMPEKYLLSLFDFSGGWSNPFREVTKVFQVDIKLGIDILGWDYKAWGEGKNVVGVLAAPPCTHFTVSGNQYWQVKDNDGRTDEMIKLAEKAIEIIEYFNPKFWALENPVGRIEKCVPYLKGKRVFSFHPCDFGEPYTKKTIIWGHCSPFLVKSPVEPTEGSKMWAKYGGKSERTKELRSVTPEGFSKAFFEAHKIYFE